MFSPEEDRVFSVGPVWHGTALGWKKRISSRVNKIPASNERFCGIKYYDKTSSIKIIAFSVYLPTSGHDEEFLETLSQLDNTLKMNHEKDEIILIGLDSNQSSKSTRRRSEGMAGFLNRFSLQSVLKNDAPTFHHHGQASSSQIDHILFSIPKTSSVNVELFEHICSLEASDNFSSHDVIVSQVILPNDEHQADSTDYSSTYTDFSVKRPLWNSDGLPLYQKKVSETLNFISNEFKEPAFLPVISELVSKALVTSAESSFPTSKPVKRSQSIKRNKIQFSEIHIAAYESHKQVCQYWRQSGRPSDPNHPAKKAKLESQRRLQKIAREEQFKRALDTHESLMASFSKDINYVYKELKKHRGEHSNNNDIPYIETLNGTFSDKNVLEGFCSNTETLCNRKTSIEDNPFYKMCIEDNIIIFDIEKDHPTVPIPLMTLERLKMIIFKRLKTGKACDINKLTVEHLR